jgi:hypothetical protein
VRVEKIGSKIALFITQGFPLPQSGGEVYEFFKSTVLGIKPHPTDKTIT